MLAKIKRVLKAKYFSAKPNGQYRFLLQKWESIADFDLANAMLQSEFFRSNLMPLPVETERLKKVVVFAPHQDDESIGCGGILTHLAKQGCKIELVFLTDGRPLGTKAEDIVRIRRNEAVRVAQALSATMNEIGINNVTLDVNQQHLTQIRDLVTSDVDALFTVWPLDNPPKHRFCDAVLAKALEKSSMEQLQVLNYAVHTALVPNVYFDYTQYFENKQALIGYHESQMEAQNYAHISAGLDAWNSRYLPWSSNNRYVEIFTQIPLKEWLLITRKYDSLPNQAFKGNKICLEKYTQLKSLN